MANDVAALNACVASFTGAMQRAGFRARPAQSLVSPAFEGEFNRCVEHEYLNDMLAHHDASENAPWFEVSMACRLQDSKKVEFGSHATVFEMLTAVSQAPRADKVHATNRLARLIMDILSNGYGLDPARIWITYFAGGEVLPGVFPGEDLLGKEAFRSVGVKPEHVVPIFGPKNFLLFVGRGERAGPKYELLYELEGSSRRRLVEVGTGIMDCFRVFRTRQQGDWTLSETDGALHGFALGAERLIAAQLSEQNIWNAPPLRSMALVAETVSTQPAVARAILSGDQRIICDLSRAALFISSCGVSTGSVLGGRLLLGLFERIRRKMAVLGVSLDGVDALLGDVVGTYADRYPELKRCRAGVVASLSEVPWPDAWNPAAYIGPA